MSRPRFLTGPGKFLVYARIALHVAGRYAARCRKLGWTADDYLLFLRRALRLLLVFRHNKVVRIAGGYKLHLYVPAYPSPAFFHTLDGKLAMRPPGPTTVVLSMTKACRYRCRHCYQRHDGGQDLDEARLVEVTREMQAVGVALFNIEGGEPFVKLPRLLKVLQALDRRAEVWVNTTGDGVTPEAMEPLKAAGMAGVMVSIHSPDPAAHDAFTGVPGAFDRAAGALRLFRQHGFGTVVNSVLSEPEVRAGGLDRLMALARDLECDYVQLIHPKPAGEWLNRTEDMQLDAAVIDRLRRDHLRYNSPATRGFPSLAAQVFEESETVLGCTSGGVDRFYLNAHGEVQPCEFMNLSFGNVKDEPFAVILERMRSHFRVPGTDWLCCTQARAIADLVAANGITRMPVPWEHTRKLAGSWNRGKPTPVYQKLGIYR